MVAKLRSTAKRTPASARLRATSCGSGWCAVPHDARGMIPWAMPSRSSLCRRAALSLALSAYTHCSSPQIRRSATVLSFGLGPGQHCRAHQARAEIDPEVRLVAEVVVALNPG